MKRILNSEKKGYIVRDKYPRELKQFIVTLHYKSPSAYRYVRDIFIKVLPHDNTVRKWYQSVDAGPGFTTESFNFIAKKCQTKEVACLCLDDIHIMKKLEKSGNNMTGGVDLGDGEQSDQLATMALTLMIHSIEKKWNIPIGYFFHSGMKSSILKDIVLHAIARLWESNVVVTNITCDGKLLLNPIW